MGLQQEPTEYSKCCLFLIRQDRLKGYILVMNLGVTMLAMTDFVSFVPLGKSVKLCLSFPYCYIVMLMVTVL